jgi:hypothetical protein
MCHTGGMRAYVLQHKQLLALASTAALLLLALASSCCSHACNSTIATHPAQEAYQDISDARE